MGSHRISLCQLVLFIYLYCIWFYLFCMLIENRITYIYKKKKKNFGRPVCDINHGILYIYIFDPENEILYGENELVIFLLTLFLNNIYLNKKINYIIMFFWCSLHKIEKLHCRAYLIRILLSV